MGEREVGLLRFVEEEVVTQVEVPSLVPVEPFWIEDRSPPVAGY